MKWMILRKAVLQEDEGQAHFVGQVEALSEDAALNRAEALFSGGYFFKSDFEAYKIDAAGESK